MITGPYSSQILLKSSQCHLSLMHCGSGTWSQPHDYYQPQPLQGQPGGQLHAVAFGTLMISPSESWYLLMQLLRSSCPTPSLLHVVAIMFASLMPSQVPYSTNCISTL